jgi:crotonobetainyl-CoA:carnitine CoA-transferase CaiB-like acyl-CoA transferase
MRLLIEADVPCGPVNTLDKALADPQVAATDMVASIEDGSGGQIRQTANPIKMSGTPSELRTKYSYPPVVGEHTEEVLSRLINYSKEEIEALRQEKVI